jgi:predicted nucleotidyltransferase
MQTTLPQVLDVLRTHQPELRRRGVQHAAIFGSIARGEARPGSDVDVLVELDPGHRMGIFEYAGLTLYIGELFGDRAHVSNRRALKPLVRDDILRDAVDAF